MRSVLPLVLITSLILPGCASQKVDRKSPDLPARHWLEDVPGVPVEKKAQIEAAVPNLYDPQKTFSFEDCVFLTIQQSPMLVNSAVDLEIKRVGLTDASLKYLPEPHMRFRISNNLTRYNLDNKDVSGDYGRTKLDISFYAVIPNPVSTYYTQKEKKIMVNMAVATHRKAIGDAIYKLAQAYLHLHARQMIASAQKKLLPVGRELVSYWQQVEAVEGNQGSSLNLARQHQRELELMAEKTHMQEVMQRTNIKVIAGVDSQQKLNVDAASATTILAGFDGYKLRWEDRWPTTEDELLLRSQVKLDDYNINVAWAEYVPTMTLNIDKYPPSGQYQPSGGTEDYFFHFDIDFPIIDWGRRYRNVQTARMRKAQAFHETDRKRTEYGNKWLQAEQRVSLAKTQLNLAKTRFDTSQMQLQEAKIAFGEGIEQFPLVANCQEALTKAQIELIEAELEYRLANLEWMYVANLLQEHFLGLPAKEVM